MENEPDEGATPIVRTDSCTNSDLKSAQIKLPPLKPAAYEICGLVVREALFVALQDIRYQFRQGSTIAWALLMPPVFFYFIGTVTGGFSEAVRRASMPLAVVADAPGFLETQIDRRLRHNGFVPDWHSTRDVEASALLIGALAANRFRYQ
jgi:hypothetical protein